MKKLNLFSDLWSSVAGSQRNDVEFDRRLTVGSPSGFAINWTLKLVSVLVLVLFLGIGNAWGATVTFTAGTDTGSGSVTKDGITISMSTMNRDDNYRCNSGTKISFSSTVGNITKIELNCTASGTSNYGPGKITGWSGYSYSGKVGTWTGNATSVTSPNSSAQVRMNSIVVTYTPSAASHTLSPAVSPTASGSVELSATSVAEGSTATATATPATHYVFDHWSISGTGSTLSSTTTNPTTVTMGTANTTVTANFVAAPKASITLSEAGATTTDASTYYVGDSYTLPSATSASCGTKVLVGWSTVEVAETNTKPTSNFYEKGASVILGATQTFYAVFATENDEGDPISISGGDMASSLPSGWSATGTDGFYSSNGVKYNSEGDYILSNDISSHGLTSVTVKFKAGYNGSEGSVLRIEAIDEEGYEIGGVNFTPTETYDHQNTVNTVVVSASSTIYSIAVELTAKTSNVGVKYCEVFKGGTTYSAYSTSCAPTPTITVSETAIEFGDKKVGGSYTETFTVSGTNLTGDINLAVSGAQAGKYSVSPTTLSPTAGTVAETTITVTFAPTASSDHAAQVDITSDDATAKTVSLHAISKWEVTWKNDGAVYTRTLVQGGNKPTFPDTPTSCDTEESNLFYGWTDAEWSGKIDDVSAKTIHKSNATMPNASNNNTIYYAVFVKRTGSVDEYTDDLTRTTTGISSGSGYGAWIDKSASNTGHSSAVYAGQSAGGNNAIQLRATSPSGIITTTSGGKAKKVTVVWNSNTADGRTLDIYGKNAAYEAASDLYANATQGTKIGSIVYGTSTELTIADDYEYIGIRSNSGALYLDKVSIDWQDGEYSYSKYMTNCCDYYITVAEPTKTGTGTGTVTFSCGGSAVAAGSDVATCAGETTITATVTPTPGHQCDVLSFTGGSVSVSPAIPDPFVPFDNAGATIYTLTFAQNTNATLATAVTFTVLHDYYIDYMHDNAKVTKNGNYGTAPSLSNTSPGDGCSGAHYKFIGWIPEADMNMETGEPTTTANMVAGGATGKYATGTNYYAIWAEEVEP